MLAFVFAVISLSSIDPDPVVTPAAQIHDRLNSGSGFASGDNTAGAGLTSDIKLAPVCTYGVPRFGTSLWNDASALSRTLTQPACSSMGIGMGMATSSGMAFGTPWLPAFGSGFVQLAPATLRVPSVTNATFQAPLPARFTALPAPVARAAGEPGLRARVAEPIAARAAAPTRRPAERAH